MARALEPARPIADLLMLPLMPRDSVPWRRAFDRLSTGPLHWDGWFESLRLHRIDLFVQHTLEQTPLWGTVPADVRELQVERANEARRAEAILRLSLFAAVDSLRRENVVPVVCKGILLSMDYYPAPGVRPMQDLDLWIEADQLQTAVNVMTDLGFDFDGVTKFVHRGESQVTFDIHAEMRLFAPTRKTLRDLSHSHPSGHFRVFDPEFLLVHLIVHMLGHVDEVGLMLEWLVDVVLVLRRDGADMDWQLVRGLFPPNGTWRVLLRMIAGFEALGWLRLDAPPWMRSALAREQPLSLETVLRQRRLASWGLPGVRGWARLALAELSPSFRKGRSARPRSDDLLRWPYDWLTEGTVIVHGSSAVLRRRVGHFKD